MKYKIKIKQYSTGFIRYRYLKLDERQLLNITQKINVRDGDFMVLEITEIHDIEK